MIFGSISSTPAGRPSRRIRLTILHGMGGDRDDWQVGSGCLFLLLNSRRSLELVAGYGHTMTALFQEARGQLLVHDVVLVRGSVGSTPGCVAADLREERPISCSEA